MKVFWNSVICIALLLSGTVVAYAGGGINSGNPVPYLGNNAASIEFMADIIDKDTNAEDIEIEKFARKIVLVLSQLTPEQQTEIWYGTPVPG